MDFLGLGPLEILAVLIIALIVLGPRDMANAGRTAGRTMRKIITSPTWRTITKTSKEIRNIPTRLIREAGLDEMEQEINSLKRTTADIKDSLSISGRILPGDYPADGIYNPPPSKQTPPASSPSTIELHPNSWTTPPGNLTRPNGYSGSTAVDLSAWTLPPSAPSDLLQSQDSTEQETTQN